MGLVLKSVSNSTRQIDRQLQKDSQLRKNVRTIESQLSCSTRKQVLFLLEERLAFLIFFNLPRLLDLS